MPEGQFLEQFSFEQTEVVDWYALIQKILKGLCGYL
jgi:hypothetical protein